MGFGFDLTDVTVQKDPTKVKSREYTCTQCKLYTKCNTPKVQIEGEGRKGILILGSGVSLAYENSKGENHGSHYNYLKKRLKEVYIDIKKDCWYLPAIRCHTRDEYGARTSKACHSLLIKDIAKYKPKLIITACKESWDILLYDRMGGRAGSVPYAKWCGEIIPDQKLKTWIMPIYDTANIIRDENEQAEKKYPNYYYEPYYSEMLDNIHPTLEQDVPSIEYENKVQIANSIETALDMIKDVMTWPSFAFDIETTGLRAEAEGMKIHSISFACNEIAYGMLWYGNDEQFMYNMADLMLNDAPKIAHNMQFEYVWMVNHLGVEPYNLKQDPMLMQHSLHNQKPTSLKFLTFAHFGVLGYDEDADEFLKPPSSQSRAKGYNAINTIFKAPKRDILFYCALDSLFTVWLAKKLYKRLDPIAQRPGYKLFVDASEALADAHINGFRIDTEAVETIEPEVIEKKDNAYFKIINDRLIVRSWRGSKRFNPGSDLDIRKLLFDILDIEPVEFTEKGAPAVDEEALLQYKDDCPLVMDILEYRRWNKVANTFIAQIRRESVGEWLHSYFGLNGVATFRSSATRVNIQNQPKRDKEVLKIIRSLFYPHHGHKLVEYDYGALEVGGAAVISRDPKLVYYVEQVDSDMHLDLAVKLWMMYKSEVPKALRQLTKLFTFSQFYGSYYALIAKTLWKTIRSPNAETEVGVNIRHHLKKKGIHTYEDWENHCQKTEKWLWEQQFPIYKQWRNDTYKEFKDVGYIDYPNGFRYHGPASRNASLNAPVQGTSFHFNVWAFTQVNRELKERGMKSKFVGQIHDSQLYSVHPDEEILVDRLVWHYGIKAVAEHYDFINVPLTMEKESGTVDGSWATVGNAVELTEEYVKRS